MVAFGNDVSSNQVVSAGRRQRWARRAGRERGHVNDLEKVHSGGRPFRSVSTLAQDGGRWRSAAKGGARRAALGPESSQLRHSPRTRSFLHHSATTPCPSGRDGGSSVVERRIRDRNVSGSKPGRSGGRIYFSGVSFLC